MSSRTCSDWPALMELDPDLQFKHYTLREAQLPGEVLLTLDAADLDAVALCCDLASHVFNPDHTDPAVAAALRDSHWFDLREWAQRRRSGGGAG